MKIDPCKCKSCNGTGVYMHVHSPRNVEIKDCKPCLEYYTEQKPIIYKNKKENYENTLNYANNEQKIQDQMDDRETKAMKEIIKGNR